MTRTSWLLHWTFVALFAFVAVACQTSTTGKTTARKSKVKVAKQPDPLAPQAFFWEAKGPNGAKLYLLGSVHLGDGRELALDPRIEKDWQNAQELVVELDTAALSDIDAIGATHRHGLLPEPTVLSQVVRAETYGRLQQYVQQRGYDMDRVDQMRPWLVAQVVTGLEYDAAGLQAQNGVDAVLLRRARGHKPIVPLETLEQQMALFAGMPDALQETWLLEILREAPAFLQVTRAILTAWEQGDEATLEGLLFGSAAADPQLAQFYARVFDGRNQTMAERLAALSADGKPRFVVVGTGHMLGTRGIPELLAERGFEVERVGSARVVGGGAIAAPIPPPNPAAPTPTVAPAIPPPAAAMPTTPPATTAAPATPPPATAAPSPVATPKTTPSSAPKRARSAGKTPATGRAAKPQQTVAPTAEPPAVPATTTAEPVPVPEPEPPPTVAPAPAAPATTIVAPATPPPATAAPSPVATPKTTPSSAPKRARSAGKTPATGRAAKQQKTVAPTAEPPAVPATTTAEPVPVPEPEPPPMVAPAPAAPATTIVAPPTPPPATAAPSPVATPTTTPSSAPKRARSTGKTPATGRAAKPQKTVAPTAEPPAVPVTTTAEPVPAPEPPPPAALVPDAQTGTAVAPSVAPPAPAPATPPAPPSGPSAAPASGSHDDWLRQDAPVR